MQNAHEQEQRLLGDITNLAADVRAHFHLMRAGEARMSYAMLECAGTAVDQLAADVDALKAAYASRQYNGVCRWEYDDEPDDHRECDPDAPCAAPQGRIHEPPQ